jgi:hypothetical protein
MQFCYCFGRGCFGVLDIPISTNLYIMLLHVFNKLLNPTLTGWATLVQPIGMHCISTPWFLHAFMKDRKK